MEYRYHTKLTNYIGKFSQAGSHMYDDGDEKGDGENGRMGEKENRRKWDEGSMGIGEWEKLEFSLRSYTELH